MLLSECPDHFICIYKINYPNNKIYIGLTIDLKRRFYEHNNFKKAELPCDLAIKKYGKIKEVEILEQDLDPSELDEREIYWIQYYHSNERDIGYNLTIGGSTLSGENSPVASFTNEEATFIRKSRFEGKRKIDIYNKYFSNRSFSTFEKIWLGKGYPDAGKEFLIEPNTISRLEYSSKANKGENNNKAKLTWDDVHFIRLCYNNGMPITNIYENYFLNKVSRSTIRKVCKNETWKE